MVCEPGGRTSRTLAGRADGGDSLAGDKYRHSSPCRGARTVDDGDWLFPGAGPERLITRRSSTTSAATPTASRSATSAFAVSTTARCASAIPPKRRLPQEDDDAHGDRSRGPASARVCERVPDGCRCDCHDESRTLIDIGRPSRAFPVTPPRPLGGGDEQTVS